MIPKNNLSFDIKSKKNLFSISKILNGFSISFVYYRVTGDPRYCNLNTIEDILNYVELRKPLKLKKYTFCRSSLKIFLLNLCLPVGHR